MDIVIKKTDINIIVKVSGSMNSSNAEEFDKKFSELSNADILNKGGGFVIIDLSDLEYISSAGLRVMLSAYKKIKNLDGRLVLCNLQEIVYEVFDLAGFLTIFEVIENSDEMT